MPFTKPTREECEKELLSFNLAPHVTIERAGDGSIHISAFDDTGFGPGVILKPDGSYELEYVATCVDKSAPPDFSDVKKPVLPEGGSPIHDPWGLSKLD